MLKPDGYAKTTDIDNKNMHHIKAFQVAFILFQILTWQAILIFLDAFYLQVLQSSPER